MPYRKPYRKNVRRKRYGRRRGLASAVAKNTRALAVLPRTPRKEIRFVNADSTMNTFSDFQRYMTFTNISLGDQINQRDGYVIHIHAVYFRVFVNNEDPALASATTNRIMTIGILGDKSRAEPPDTSGYTNFFEDSTFAEVAPSSVNTQDSYLYNRQLWNVYKKRRLLLQNNNQTGDSKQAVLYKRFPGKGHRVEYKRTNNTDVVSGELYGVLNLYEMGQASSTTDLNVQWQARVWFTSG